MRNMLPQLEPIPFPALRRDRVATLQLNLGYRCNLSCNHCHVGAGPHRTETMSREILELALEYAGRHQVRTLDLTGGSPEMHPDFRWLVTAARAAGHEVMDRCNPTILNEPGYEGTAEFLAEHGVEVVASLPCYLEDNVDSQRGKGVYRRSVDGLRQLNGLGYGMPESELTLNLVYNPLGPSLPPPQEALEVDYRRFLGEHSGIRFNRLFTITNMPIQRFGAVLVATGQFDHYMTVLRQAFRSENLDQVMCRTLLSVDWEGYLYDCDFNQMLSLPLGASTGRTHLRDVMDHGMVDQSIAVAGHCYGCVAGQGSSCGGALQASPAAS